MTDVLCALGISQLKKLDRFVARPRELTRLNDEALKPLAPRVRPVPPVADCDPALHFYAVLVDFDYLKIMRQQLIASLRKRGSGTQVHYIPVHRQPYYRDRYGEIALPGADAYYSRELSLPLFPAMRRRCPRCASILDGEEHAGRTYDTFACHYATAPLRRADDVAAVVAIAERDDADFALAVTAYPLPPHQALRLGEDGALAPMWPDLVTCVPTRSAGWSWTTSAPTHSRRR